MYRNYTLPRSTLKYFTWNKQTLTIRFSGISNIPDEQSHKEQYSCSKRKHFLFHHIGSCTKYKEEEERETGMNICMACEVHAYCACFYKTVTRLLFRPQLGESLLLIPHLHCCMGSTPNLLATRDSKNLGTWYMVSTNVFNRDMDVKVYITEVLWTVVLKRTLN